jgi:IS30 family transposase
MGRSYEQLSLRERVEIEIWRGRGWSLRRIGEALGRSAGTISRELRRNGKPTKQWAGSYQGERAHGLARRRRRWDARYKLVRQPALQSVVRQGLAMGHSPEQIAGRLALEHGKRIISHESIYRFVYYRSSLKDYWHRYLPRHKSRRGRLGRRGGSSASFIKPRLPISARPLEAADRCVPGHWEADLMAFARYGQYVLVTHERTSRLLSIERLPSKHAPQVATRLLERFAALPQAMRRSLTFDNGTEFARHELLNQTIGLATFFCDTHAPWQKGASRMPSVVCDGRCRARPTLPPSQRINSMTWFSATTTPHANALPSRPRTRSSPASSTVLHFKRESAFPPARE